MESNVSELLALFFVAGRSIRESMRKGAADGKGVPFLQFETLRYVKERGRPLMRDVAEYFRITPPAATLLVDCLVREKFVKRIFDKKDRRAVRLALTRAGREYLIRGTGVYVTRWKKLFSMLTPDERAKLIVILKKISRNINTV